MCVQLRPLRELSQSLPAAGAPVAHSLVCAHAQSLTLPRSSSECRLDSLALGPCLSLGASLTSYCKLALRFIRFVASLALATHRVHGGDVPPCLRLTRYLVAPRRGSRHYHMLGSSSLRSRRLRFIVGAGLPDIHRAPRPLALRGANIVFDRVLGAGTRNRRFPPTRQPGLSRPIALVTILGHLSPSHVAPTRLQVSFAHVASHSSKNPSGSKLFTITPGYDLCLRSSVRSVYITAQR